MAEKDEVFHTKSLAVLYETHVVEETMKTTEILETHPTFNVMLT